MSPHCTAGIIIGCRRDARRRAAEAAERRAQENVARTSGKKANNAYAKAAATRKDEHPNLASRAQYYN